MSYSYVPPYAIFLASMKRGLKVCHRYPNHIPSQSLGSMKRGLKVRRSDGSDNWLFRHSMKRGLKVVSLTILGVVKEGRSMKRGLKVLLGLPTTNDEAPNLNEKRIESRK